MWVCVAEGVRGKATAERELWDCKEPPDRAQAILFHFIRDKKIQVGKRQGELISQVMCASGMGPLREEGKF